MTHVEPGTRQALSSTDCFHVGDSQHHPGLTVASHGLRAIISIWKLTPQTNRGGGAVIILVYRWATEI